MCYLRASVLFISFRFLTFFSFLFFFFCFVSFLTILFSLFFAFRFFPFLFVTFLLVFFSFFFLSVSLRFFSFFFRLSVYRYPGLRTIKKISVLFLCQKAMSAQSVHIRRYETYNTSIFHRVGFVRV